MTDSLLPSSAKPSLLPALSTASTARSGPAAQHSGQRAEQGSSDLVTAAKRASLLGATASTRPRTLARYGVATSDGREGQSRDHDAHERDGGERQKDQGRRSEGLELGNLGGALGMQDTPRLQAPGGPLPHAQGQGLKGPSPLCSVTLLTQSRQRRRTENLQNGN